MNITDYRRSSARVLIGTASDTIAIGGVTVSSNTSAESGSVLVATGSNTASWQVVAFGSNANDVGLVSFGGSSSCNSRADHVHRGVTSLSHASNTLYGNVVLITPDNTVSITSPVTGTLALSSAGGGSGASDLAGKELGYAEITSNVSVTATTEAGADIVVTAPAVAGDGVTKMLVEFYTPFINPDTTVAGRGINVYLFEDGATLGRIGLAFAQVAGVNAHQEFYAARRLTPTAGSRTYSIRAAVSAGTAAVGAGLGGAGADVPAFIRVTRITS